MAACLHFRVTGFGVGAEMTTHLMNNYGQRRLSLVKGEGAWVWDSDNNRYLDCVAGIAVCGLGHCHPEITSVISEQAATLVHSSNLYNVPWQERLADRLCTAGGMARAFFCNSGAEANEAAIKLARLKAYKAGIAQPEIIVMEGAFHGRTLATLSATHGAKVQKGFAPLVQGFVRVPYNDIAAVAAAGTKNTVAVLVEPIQGEAGINIPSSDYLPALRALCDERGWLLMLDEIQSGNGRTGRYFAWQHSQSAPDVLTTAKGLGNGMPIGACLARGEAAEYFWPGSHGSTYGGNPLACRVADKVVEIITEQRLDQAAGEMGDYLLAGFRERLENCAQVVDIRSAGLMLAVEMSAECADLVTRAAEQGLLINVTGGNRIRLLPPLTFTREQADLLLETLCPIIQSWEPAT